MDVLFTQVGLDLAWRAVLILFAMAIVRSVIARAREGSFDFYGTRVERQRNPGSFWSVVAVALGGAVGFVLIAAR
jgi:hypothetical protein